MKNYFMAVMLLVIGSSNAFAEYAYGISVVDGVKGGCLLNPGKIKDAIELSLRQSGFDVVELIKNPDYFEVITNGLKVNNLCVLHLSVSLYEVKFSASNEAFIITTKLGGRLLYGSATLTQSETVST